MIIHNTVSQIPWNGNSRFPKKFGIPSKKRVILQVWRDHKTINFANSILLEVLLTVWQQDLKAQHCRNQRPILDMINSQLHTPPVFAIHPSKTFWILSIAPKTKCFYQSFSRSFTPKHYMSLYFWTNKLKKKYFFISCIQWQLLVTNCLFIHAYYSHISPVPHSSWLIFLQNLLQFTGIDQSREFLSVITYPVDRMNNAIGSWNITILYCGGANVDMSLVISPNSYKFPTEGLNTIGEWPGCGTHAHTAESLCNKNIWVHDQWIFNKALISRVMH